MRLPRSLIVPDSKPPYLLLGMGAVLLTALVVRTLRRRKSRRAGTSSRGPITVGTWSTPRAQATTRSTRKKSSPAALAATNPSPAEVKSKRRARVAA